MGQPIRTWHKERHETDQTGTNHPPSLCVLCPVSRRDGLRNMFFKSTLLVTLLGAAALATAGCGVRSINDPNESVLDVYTSPNCGGKHKQFPTIVLAKNRCTGHILLESPFASHLESFVLSGKDFDVYFNSDKGCSHMIGQKQPVGAMTHTRDVGKPPYNYNGAQCFVVCRGDT
ncbi:hypothetical protein BV22DRAFT_489627 [Leucogyrophana mollusca]|uniref:Uncharacterized protein n=1 Tax=Leucogyrophana mollusca TaxID=85980 RepID=A0ACB8BIY7_9AGAM|nr:hypothetical protein BV22DRAFT_489627 [Leucogyrophana mollusca]